MKKLCAFILCFCQMASLSALTMNDDMPIKGRTYITIEEAEAWARSKNATDVFISLARIYWVKAEAMGINPAIAYCQSAKETGYGRFGGIVPESFNNPCGIKRDGCSEDTRDDHHWFDSWEDGVDAHLDHLALYAGFSGFPKKKSETKDPRHYKFIFGRATTVKELGGYGRWAPSPTYGLEILDMVKGLEGEALANR